MLSGSGAFLGFNWSIFFKISPFMISMCSRSSSTESFSSSGADPSPLENRLYYKNPNICYLVVGKFSAFARISTLVSRLQNPISKGRQFSFFSPILLENLTLSSFSLTPILSRISERYLISFSCLALSFLTSLLASAML